MKHRRAFVVLGGAGAIGRIVVRDLFESDPRNNILVADRDEAAARAIAGSYRARRVTAAAADATDVRRLARTIKGAHVLINSTHHAFNLQVMEACLAARVDYIDLGGLFVWTRKQLRLDSRYKAAGRVAVLGMGCAPGITNLMAWAAAAQLERVESVRIRVAGVDCAAEPAGFSFPYSARTIIEELTLTAWRWSGGHFRESPPRSNWEKVTFPDPVGSVSLVETRHSEIATLPLSLRSKGLRFADFKVGFDRRFVRELFRRLNNGWTVPQLEALSVPREKPDDYEIVRVIVKGRSNSRRCTITTDCHARPRPQWKASAGDIDTACPASIVAQMIVDGAIQEKGVFPPERVVPLESFFKECERRGMKFVEERA